MCHVKNLNAYKTSQELLMEINNCCSCPSVGSLISDPSECVIFQRMLKRYTEMIQREYLKLQKEKEEVNLPIGKEGEFQSEDAELEEECES